MFIIKIIVFILLFVFVMGMLGGMGLLGIAGHFRKQFDGMMNDFTKGEGAQKGAHKTVETGDVDLEECPKCGTYTESNNYCEACGHKW